MRKSIVLAALFASPLVVSPILATAAPTDLIVNGSFESNTVASGTATVVTSIAGWAVNSNLELLDKKGGLAAQAGNNYAQLDVQTGTLRNGQPLADNYNITESLTTVVGTTYDLSFYYANSAGSLAASNGIAATFGNGSANVGQTNGAAVPGWTQFTTSFVATSTTSFVGFTALGTADGVGTAIDNISVFAEQTPVAAVPEPETYALLAAGLCAVGVVVRRRKS